MRTELPCDAEAGEREREKDERKETGRHPGEPSTTQHPRGACLHRWLKNPSPSRSLVGVGIVIVGICSVYIHPREFLFIARYGLVRRSIPALDGNTAEPFTSDLHERWAR